MKKLISAIQFLTIIPAGKSDYFDPEGTAQFFPVAGLGIGILLAIVDSIAIRLWSTPVAAVVDVVFLAAVTGALHLDGLGDAADGLYGHQTRERALEIMKDSRVGMMGVVVVICGLAVKWGGISGLTEDRFLLLVIVPAYARGAMLFGFTFLEYGRPDGGTGSEFFKKKPDPSSYIWLVVPVVLSVFLGWKCIWFNLCFAGITAGILIYYRKKIGCITGDMLGAMVEVNEAMLFMLVSINF
ncbi:MAG: adenosylcobinamide-GDP ribazoletransferase [Desulfobacterales bacterium]|nr:adenosylcobinamide-GDP ribazoletransferase [Desulfobacterales bacterium]